MQLIVIAKQGQIRALGTHFLVRREGGYNHISALEQAVEITPAATHAQTLRLEAGQQTRFNRNGFEQIRPLSGRPAAWAQGQLIVSDWALSEFPDELSRHRRGLIGYDDASAALRISGAFHLDNIDALLDNLAATLPVTVRPLQPLLDPGEHGRSKQLAVVLKQDPDAQHA